MPVTITQQPNQIASSNNDNYYLVTSSLLPVSESAFLDLKYVASVVDATGSVLCMLKSFPDPIYRYGLFNMKNISSAFTSYDFFPDSISTDIFHTASHSYKKLQLKFGEEYILLNSGSSLEGVFISASLTVTSSLIPYWNAALSWKDQSILSAASFLLDGETDGSKTFMQNYPIVTTALKANNTLKQWLYYYTNANKVNRATVSTYNSSNTLLGTYLIDNPYSGSEGVQAISIGYPQLNTLSTASYTASFGTKPIITANVSYYKVAVGALTGFSTPEVRYNINNTCSKFSQFNVYWLNEAGGFDSWTFNKKSEEKQSKTVSEIKKIYGKINANGTHTVNLYDHNTINHFTELTDKITLSSDFLTDIEVIYLKGLFSSPVIFIEDSDGYIFSANVSETEYTLTKKVNQKIYSLVLNFDYSYKSFRQLL